MKNWLLRKDPDAGKDWRQEEMGATEDEMVGWHHWLNRLEFEQAPGVGDEQGMLACYPWDHKELKWVTWEAHGKEYIYIHVLVARSCPTLCDPMDCSPPSSSVHGILQARIPEWVAIPLCKTESLCYTGEINTTSLINYMLTKCFKYKTILSKKFFK